MCVWGTILGLCRTHAHTHTHTRKHSNRDAYTQHLANLLRKYHLHYKHTQQVMAACIAITTIFYTWTSTLTYTHTRFQTNTYKYVNACTYGTTEHNPTNAQQRMNRTRHTYCTTLTNPCRACTRTTSIIHPGTTTIIQKNTHNRKRHDGTQSNERTATHENDQAYILYYTHEPVSCVHHNHFNYPGTTSIIHNNTQ